MKFIRLNTNDYYYLVAAHEESRLEMDVKKFVDKDEDTLMCLELLDGSSLYIRASAVESFTPSAPEDRRRGLEQVYSLELAEKQIRAELGSFE